MTQMRGTINNYKGDAKTMDNRQPCRGRKLEKRVWNKACVITHVQNKTS